MNTETVTIQQILDEHTAKNIVASPHFPAPIDIKGRTGWKSKNLYVSGEVVAFCLRWKKKKVRL